MCNKKTKVRKIKLNYSNMNKNSYFSIQIKNYPMQPFLQKIASKYYEEHGAKIADFTFVFPNRRAGLFFQKYLSEKIEKPIFSPQITTISDCFLSASELNLSDRATELFTLFDLFIKHSKSEEKFDTFVFWGEMLLTDFNDVDKYIVDATQLYANIKGLKEIDSLFDVFSEKQKEAITYFWEHFLPNAPNKSREDFISIWKILLQIYQDFHSQLIKQNLATEGMIFRNVAEKLVNNEEIPFFNDKQFIFIGFNMLNPCEKILFDKLNKQNKADFYWDYESAELRDPENQASKFYESNTQQFKSKHVIDAEEFLMSEKEFEVIATPSTIGQTKEVYRILNEKMNQNNEIESNWLNTAVVLPNENLLIPLLYSLPENIDNVNITMGYPLKSTPIVSFVELLYELQKRINSEGLFYYKNVINILNHQYINTLHGKESQKIETEISKYNIIYVEKEKFQNNDLFQTIFVQCTSSTYFLDYLLDVIRKLNKVWFSFSEESENKKQFQIESQILFSYYAALNRLKDVSKVFNVDEKVSIDAIIRLIRQFTSTISIPFEGEPLSGLQIMGMLETRTLDFENLIICSFNEGVFPKKSNINTFIPMNLRRAFGMPVSDFHDAIAAYNFYRLVHRAKKIFLLYDTRNDGIKTGEISRYYHQLHYHYGAIFNHISLSNETSIEKERKIEIQKTPEVMESMNAFLSDEKNAPALSASSISTYLNCPLQFYLSTIEKIKEIDEVTETIEASMFGDILHKTMELIYKPFEGKQIEKDDLEPFVKNPDIIDEAIEDAFANKFYKKALKSKVKLEGNNLLIARVIKKYVVQIIKQDIAETPFQYIQSEKLIHSKIPIQGGKQFVNLKGFIDRIDQKEGIIRIVDYKTGSAGNLRFDSVEELFDKTIKSQSEKKPRHILQVFLYSLLLEQEEKVKAKPTIFYIKNIFKGDFSTTIINKINNNTTEFIEIFDEPYQSEFKQNLTVCLEEIFDKNIPFKQTENVNSCKWCPFKKICKR